MHDYLLLDEFALAWSEDRKEAMETTRAEILRQFWEGRFEGLGLRNGPGTILKIREDSRANFPDQFFDGIPFGREEFLVQVFLTGPCAFPTWKRWSPIFGSTGDKLDPFGLDLKRRHVTDPTIVELSEGYRNLRDCPFDKYEFPAEQYLLSLGFPLEHLARYFADRLRNRPPFLVKAQAKFSGAVTADAAGPGRRRHAYDEAQLRAWFAELVERKCASRVKMSADDVHSEAKKTFHPDVPRTLIRRLHRELAPAGWHKRGRKPAAG